MNLLLPPAGFLRFKLFLNDGRLVLLSTTTLLCKIGDYLLTASNGLPLETSP